MELETLLERCRAGDELAWEALVRRFQGKVFALAYHYLRDREEARDVAQETFIRIYKGLEGFQDSERFLPWMVRIARNCSIDRVRRLKVRPPLGGDELDEQTVAVSVPQAFKDDIYKLRRDIDLVRRQLKDSGASATDSPTSGKD